MLFEETQTRAESQWKCNSKTIVSTENTKTSKRLNQVRSISTLELTKLEKAK